jgi:hypothetical protein
MSKWESKGEARGLSAAAASPPSVKMTVSGGGAEQATARTVDVGLYIPPFAKARTNGAPGSFCICPAHVIGLLLDFLIKDRDILERPELTSELP